MEKVLYCILFIRLKDLTLKGPKRSFVVVSVENMNKKCSQAKIVPNRTKNVRKSKLLHCIHGLLRLTTSLIDLFWSCMVKYRFDWTFSQGHRYKFIWLVKNSKDGPSNLGLALKCTFF